MSFNNKDCWIPTPFFGGVDAKPPEPPLRRNQKCPNYLCGKHFQSLMSEPPARQCPSCEKEMNKRKF